MPTLDFSRQNMVTAYAAGGKVKSKAIDVAKLLLLLMILSGCSSTSASGKVTKTAQTVKSWTATAHLVGDAWMQGSVPTPYAKKTLQAAEQDLQKQAEMLQKKAPTQQQMMLLEHLQRSKQIMNQMSSAIEQKDRTQMMQLIQQISTEEQTLNPLAKPAGEPL